jgi:hypothetical protein
VIWIILRLSAVVELGKPNLGLMQFRLPFAGCGIPCFKLRDTEVYLVVNQTLCSFTAFEVRPLIRASSPALLLKGIKSLNLSNRSPGLSVFPPGFTY